jgi:hypothetical protein
MGESFGIRDLRNGVLIMERGAKDQPGSREALEQWLRQSPAEDAARR